MFETTLKWFGAIIVCLILQTSLVPLIAIFGIQPDLLIIILFLMCMKHGVLPGVYIGFLLGLGMDLYTPAHLGQNALAKTVTGFFLGFFNEKIIQTDLILKIIIIIIGFVIHDIIFSGAELLKNNNSLIHLFLELITRTFPRAIYTIIIVFLIYVWDTTIKPNLKR